MERKFAVGQEVVIHDDETRVRWAGEEKSFPSLEALLNDELRGTHPSKRVEKARAFVERFGHNTKQRSGLLNAFYVTR